MKCKSCAHRAELHEVITSALSHYGFSTPDIRWIIGLLLGQPAPKRKIGRIARANGLKWGRPPTVPRVARRDLRDLIVATCQDPAAVNGNMLHLVHDIGLQFGLSPRQYLNWVERFVRRGGYMMRPCLHCGRPFPSIGPWKRRCPTCRRRLRGSEQIDDPASESVWAVNEG